jgi:dipeptidase E
MTVFLISSIETVESDLHDALLEEIAERGNTVGYISSRPQIANAEKMKELIMGYQKISPHIDINYFDIKTQFTAITQVVLLRQSVLHIEAEDLQVFMDTAKIIGLDDIFKAHIDKGGMIIGAGLGAIVLTPTLKTAVIQNQELAALSSFDGFGRVDFEFVPHYLDFDDATPQVLEYAKETNRRVFACHDGDGIKVLGDKVSLFGKTVEVEG